MKFSTIILGALAAFTVSAAPPAWAENDKKVPGWAENAKTVTKHDIVTVTATQTYTKYQETKVTVTETITHAHKVKVTVTESVTHFRTKTFKMCPTASTATQSVMPKATKKAARAVGEQPLYAAEFA